MGLTSFVRDLPEQGVRASAYRAHEWLLRQLPVGEFGPSIYDYEWDVLVVLDACRTDVLREVAPDVAWLPSADEIGGVPSVACSSKQWMEQNFGPENAHEAAETAYVTGNPFSERVFGSTDPFACLDEVWQYGWDDEYGTVLPETITDRAIQVGRETGTPMIVHYMQPHLPFVSDMDLHPGYDRDHWGAEESVQRDGGGADLVWNQLRSGKLRREEVWAAYRRNLLAALPEVDRLRRNVDADEFVISADHGNAFGEWGVYGHPPDVPIPPVVDVPFVSVDATDEGSSRPSMERPRTETPDGDVSDRLSSLGYTE